MDQAITQKITSIKTELFNAHFKTAVNFLGSEDRAIKFMSAIIYNIQRTPKLLECDRNSLIQSFLTGLEYQLMPSSISGEYYVLPYNTKRGMMAQFQLGYQGLVTLFYRAGIRSIVAEIVRDHDKFSYHNGIIEHEPDIFSDDRGATKGAYVIIELQEGSKQYKVMTKKEILNIGEKFSKSYNSEHTPWNEKNDPELWMWKKTVLKQAAKLVPKNETIYKAIDMDNKDSVLSDRLEQAQKESTDLTMGKLLTTPTNENQTPQTQAKAQAPENN